MSVHRQLHWWHLQQFFRHTILTCMCVIQKATAQSSASAGNSLYAQPMKVKASASQNSSQNAGSSSYERGMQVLSPAVHGPDVQSSPSAYRRPVPQPIEFGSSRAVMSDGQLASRAGQTRAMYGQLGGFDESGLPLVQKGDCGACGQPITGQVRHVFNTYGSLFKLCCDICCILFVFIMPGVVLGIGRISPPRFLAEHCKRRLHLGCLLSIIFCCVATKSLLGGMLAFFLTLKHYLGLSVPQRPVLRRCVMNDTLRDCSG